MKIKGRGGGGGEESILGRKASVNGGRSLYLIRAEGGPGGRRAESCGGCGRARGKWAGPKRGGAGVRGGFRKDGGLERRWGDGPCGSGSPIGCGTQRNRVSREMQVLGRRT